MLELILGVLLAAGAIYYVLLPMLRATPAAATAAREAADEGEDPDDDMSTRAVALRALKEIEFDRATGKLSDADYESLKAKYTGEALAAMRGEAGNVPRETGNVTQATTFPVSRFPCPEHGPRPEKDAQFCSDCGRRLGAAAAYCPRCGTTLESDARYCNSCGARAAA